MFPIELIRLNSLFDNNLRFLCITPLGNKILSIIPPHLLPLSKRPEHIPLILLRVQHHNNLITFDLIILYVSTQFNQALVDCLFGCLDLRLDVFGLVLVVVFDGLEVLFL